MDTGPGVILLTVGTTAECPSSGDVDLFAQVTFECLGPGDAAISLNDTTGACIGVSGPIDITNDPLAITIHQVLECMDDIDCPYTQDGLFCTGTQTCIDHACVPPTAEGPFNPCNDGDDCTLNICEEGATEAVCTYPCDLAFLMGPTTDCCSGEPCASVCPGSGPTLIKETSYYTPTAEPPITIKNRVCMDNWRDLVGGIQFDLCDEPDCMICIDCELTERTTMFDCVVLELPNGCCRVIMFCKNPGCAMNPGLCNFVTIVQQMKDPAPPECGQDCIIETFWNIVVSDYDGYELGGSGLPGSVCPVICGDVCPPGSGTTNDCGDGMVDIYDIMCEVDFVLTATTPNACQAPRANVPTGTPPDCLDPDGDIDILDIMVIIDMALNRQDCCTFYYTGVIY